MADPLGNPDGPTTSGEKTWLAGFQVPSLERLTDAEIEHMAVVIAEELAAQLKERRPAPRDAAESAPTDDTP
jgi:hypothetical protein